MLYQVELSNGPRLSALLRFLRSDDRWAGHIRRLTVRRGYKLPSARELDEIVRLAVNARTFVAKLRDGDVDVAFARALLKMRQAVEVEVVFGDLDHPGAPHKSFVELVAGAVARHASTLCSISLRHISQDEAAFAPISMPALRKLRVHAEHGGERFAFWLAQSAPNLVELDVHPPELIPRLDPRVLGSITATSALLLHPDLLAFTSLRTLRVVLDGPTTAGDFRTIPPTVQTLVVENYKGDSLQVGISMLADEVWLPELATLRWRYRTPADPYEASIRARQRRQLIAAAEAWSIDCQAGPMGRRPMVMADPPPDSTDSS